MNKTLDDDEREALRAVLDRPEPTVVLLHGGTFSFYAEGTRLEARIEVTDG